MKVSGCASQQNWKGSSRFRCAEKLDRSFHLGATLFSRTLAHWSKLWEWFAQVIDNVEKKFFCGIYISMGHNLPRVVALLWAHSLFLWIVVFATCFEQLDLVFFYIHIQKGMSDLVVHIESLLLASFIRFCAYQIGQNAFSSWEGNNLYHLWYKTSATDISYECSSSSNWCERGDRQTASCKEAM